MTFYRWQQKRSAINHDWLTSRFDRELYAWLAIFQGGEEDENFNRSNFELNFLCVWLGRVQDIRRLIADYEDAMSPAGLLDGPPLNAMAESSKEWLRELIHSMWKSRYDVDKQKSDVMDALDAASATFDAIGNAYKQTGFEALIGDESFITLLHEFIQRCRALGAAIHHLNREIVVV